MSQSTESTREHESETLVRRSSEGATLREGTESDTGIRDDAPVVAVPDHELLCCVGRGSYGQVWLARNVMGTYRAVKIVERASFQNARPFDREFNGILKFEPLSRAHPGMVDILQVGRTPNCFYYVMELADDVATGQQIDPLHYTPKTLRTELDAHGRLSFERCLQLALALTDALGHLHGHGLIHRDIKPSNIIFVHDLPKLADIGLVAEQADAKSFVGTEGFIPPEGPGTAQADLYSLGKVLYELATGKDRHDFPELPTFTDDGSTSDAGLIELNAVILKACQPDPKQRYASAAAMRDDLLLLQGGKSVKRSQALERRLARARRITAVAVGLAVFTAITVVFLQRQARKEAELRVRAEQGERAAEQNLLTARRNLYAGDMLLAARALAENNRGRALALLTKYLPENSGSAEDLRGWEWRMLWQRTRSDELFTLGRHTNYIAALALSPDGHTLYSASKDGTVGIWDLAARQQVGSLPHGAALHDMDLSRDGRFLAIAEKGKVLRVWDLATRTVRFAWTNAVPLGFVRFTPDAGELVYRDAEGVWRLDPAHGVRSEILHLPHEEIVHISTAAFSPDGRLFAYDGGDFSIHLLDWARRVDLGIFSPEGLGWDDNMKLGLAFSPDGKLLAAAGKDGVYVWEAATLQPVWHVARTGNENWNASPAFSPDGRLMATVSTDQRIQLWDTATWTSVATLHGHEFEVWDAVFTPDGSRLITASKDKSIRVWPVPTKTLASPAGASLAAEVGNPSAWVWDPALGRRPNQVPMPYEWEQSALSRDGSQLLLLHANGQWSVSDPVTGRISNVGEWPGIASGIGTAAVSNDGQRVAFGKDGELVVFGDTAAIEPLVRLPEGPRVTGHVQDVMCFAPDSRQVLYATAGDVVRLVDATTGAVETLFEANGRRVYSVNVSPDGQRIAAGYGGALVQWRDRSSREIHRLQTEHSEFVTSLAFSPDGQLLATGSFDPGIKLWNLSTGAKLAELSGSLQAFLSIDFSADGRRVAAGSWEGQISLWDLDQSPPMEVINWTAHGSPVEPARTWFVRFRPDGSLISVGTGGLFRLWWAPALAETDQARLGKSGAAPAAASGNASVSVRVESIDPLAKPNPATLAWLKKRRAAERLGLGDVKGAGEMDPHFALLPRDPRATAAHVDLSPHFNRLLVQDGLGGRGVDWLELPPGFQQLGGTWFDVRGIVHVFGSSPVGIGFPKQITNIQVRAKGRWLHVLQATDFGARETGRVGSYVLHYADGQTEELPIHYGEDTRNWWTVSGEPTETRNATAVWTGRTPAATAAGQSIRLWKRTYENPRPNVEITHLDFVSAMTFPAPFLVAITVE